MTDSQYADWTDYHAGLFFMHSQADTELFRLWRQSLIGFALADLKEASLWIAENDGGQFRSQHLSSLRRRISTQRAERWKREQAVRAASVTGCDWCSGTGIVIVPHKQFIVDDQWVFSGNQKPTGVVTCVCDAGAEKRHYLSNYQANKPGKLSFLTLDMYEALVPHWRELIAARQQELAAEWHVHRIADDADKKAPLPKLRRRTVAIGVMPTEDA